MTLRAFITEHGGPEVIRFEQRELPPPGSGEVRLRHTAIGLNFIDTTHRRGLYPIALPSGLGVEAAGVIEACGPDTPGWHVGDRVCLFGKIPGAYAEARNVPINELFHSPDDLADETIAALLLKACTAEFLVERCARVEPGQDVLVHAAAGGVGQLLVQWLKHRGARVIGSVGNATKIPVAEAAGCDAVLVHEATGTAREVRRFTAGKGVHVTFDGVGRETWETSLDATRRRGLIVNFGNTGPPVTGISLGVLAVKGSLYNTRPMLWDYYLEPAEREAGVQRVFALASRGVLRAALSHRYALREAPQAHADLEARRTTGAGVLVP